MIYKVLSYLFFYLLSSFLFAQTNPTEVKLEKIYTLIDKNKIENAEEELIDLLEKYPSYGKAWDLLSKIKYYNYEQAKKLPNLFGEGKIQITTTDKNGNNLENDSLSASLLDMLSNINPSDNAYNEWLLTLRKATLFSNTAYSCSITLRNTLHSIEVDSLVNEKALKYFHKAEEEFTNKNYNKAANYYQRAIDYQPDFYKALLYLGDSYYYLGNYIDAIKHFKNCSEKYPHFLEPRKYLVDAYAKEKLFDKALEEVIECMLIYPDLSMHIKMEDIVYTMKNKIIVDWQPRGVLPNTIKKNTNKLVFTEKDDAKNTVNAPWNLYTEALSKIEPYCDNQGIINKSNSLTTSKYLELYAWEEMLKNSDDETLKQAREMQNKGYLDCYIFITCFHDDIYDQYLHFVKNNHEKILDYYKNVVISNL